MSGRFVRIGWGLAPSDRHGCDLPELERWAGRLRFDNYKSGSVWECDECHKQWQIGVDDMGHQRWNRRRWFRLKPDLAIAADGAGT